MHMPFSAERRQREGPWISTSDFATLHILRPFLSQGTNFGISVPFSTSCTSSSHSFIPASISYSHAYCIPLLTASAEHQFISSRKHNV
jgi:hypothetical protein